MSKGKEFGWFYLIGQDWCRYDKKNEDFIELHYKNRVEKPFQITLKNNNFQISFQQWKQVRVVDGTGYAIKKEELKRTSSSGGLASCGTKSAASNKSWKIHFIIIIASAAILQYYYNKLY